MERANKGKLMLHMPLSNVFHILFGHKVSMPPSNRPFCFVNIILLVPSFEVQSEVVMRGTKGMTILIYEEEKVKRIKLFSWSFHF